MFKQLIELWKGKETLIDEVVLEFVEMMTIAQQMNDRVSNLLVEGKDLDGFKQDLYKQDAKLNMLEQTIRRKILAQLTSTDTVEEPIAACLILMSISKDAERIGDYSKNIFTVFEAKNELGKEEPFYGRLVTIKKKMSELFGEILVAYKESNQEKAHELVKAAFEAQKLCDENVKGLLAADPGKDHVAYALLSRFFKRILAHLSNIATSIYMPVTKIDFFDEIRK